MNTIIFNSSDIDLYNYYESNLDELAEVLEKPKEEITEEDIWKQVALDKDFCWEDISNEINKLRGVYVLTGSIGTWRGNFQGGKIVQDGQGIINSIGDYDEVKIYENSHGRVFLELSHHDGTHTLEIRELNPKGDKWMERNWGTSKYDELETIEILSKKDYSNNLKLAQKLGW